MASDLLESLWCQDALGVMLAGVQVLGTKVQFFLAQFACNRGAVLVLQGRWAGFKSLQLEVENERKLWTPQDMGPEDHTSMDPHKIGGQKITHLSSTLVLLLHKLQAPRNADKVCETLQILLD